MKYFFDNRYILWFVSLPSRECGLKFMKDDAKKEEPEVTPFAGVWIEIMMLPDPLGGMGSLPSRECGLKSFKCTSFEQFRLVTPFAGVWIEIQNMKLEHRQKISLSS